MSQPQLGKIELLGIRDLWNHEERDFTPWLAQNIEQLSAVLGVRVVVDQTEHKVGAYELDILGHVDENDAVVIIENQLSATDHCHLGQLITYAAGLEAAIVVWIAPEVRDEHRAAIKWLNDHTEKRVSFFLIRPEVFRIDSSNPAIRLQLEASPSEFTRRLKEIIDTDEAPRFEFRRRFWEALLQYLANDNHPWASGRKATKESWLGSSVGKSGIGANVSMAQGSRIRVEIYCSDDPEKELHHKLAAHRDEICKRFDNEEVSWEPMEGAASRIAVYLPYDKDHVGDDTPERRQVFAWISKNLATCRTLARQYLVDGG